MKPQHNNKTLKTLTHHYFENRYILSIYTFIQFISFDISTDVQTGQLLSFIIRLLCYIWMAPALEFTHQCLLYSHLQYLKCRNPVSWNPCLHFTNTRRGRSKAKIHSCLFLYRCDMCKEKIIFSFSVHGFHWKVLFIYISYLVPTYLTSINVTNNPMISYIYLGIYLPVIIVTREDYYWLIVINKNAIGLWSILIL